MNANVARPHSDSQVTALEALQALRAEMNAALYERAVEIDCVLTALLAGEHVLLLGPPGTGKSALVNVLAGALDTRSFAKLFTRFTTPEEVFGPYSLSGIKADRYERVVDGYLPTAEVAFLDEIFKANSAILNALLTILNERAFDNGTNRLKVPLEIAIGASNELPEDESLGALYDRFVLRRWVHPIRSRDNMRALLSGAGAPRVQARLTNGDLEELRALALEVVIPDVVMDLVLDLREVLAQQAGVEASDRRWVKAIKLLKAHAVLEGRAQVTADDLEILVDAMWDKPDERPAIYSVVLNTISPNAAQAVELRDAAFEQFSGLDLKNRQGDVQPWANANRELGRIAGELEILGLQDPRVANAHAEVLAWRQEIARAVSQALGFQS